MKNMKKDDQEINSDARGTMAHTREIITKTMKGNRNRNK